MYRMYVGNMFFSIVYLCIKINRQVFTFHIFTLPVSYWVKFHLITRGSMAIIMLMILNFLATLSTTVSVHTKMFYLKSTLPTTNCG